MTFEDVEDAIVFGLNYIGWIIVAVVVFLVIIVAILLIMNRIKERDWSGYERVGKKR